MWACIPHCLLTGENSIVTIKEPPFLSVKNHLCHGIWALSSVHMFLLLSATVCTQYCSALWEFEESMVPKIGLEGKNMTGILMMVENPFQLIVHKKLYFKKNWFLRGSTSHFYCLFFSFFCFLQSTSYSTEDMCVHRWPSLLGTHLVVQPRAAEGGLGYRYSPWHFNFNVGHVVG